MKVVSNVAVAEVFAVMICSPNSIRNCSLMPYPLPAIVTVSPRPAVLSILSASVLSPFRSELSVMVKLGSPKSGRIVKAVDLLLPEVLPVAVSVFSPSF